MLDGFVANTTPDTTFLASDLPATGTDDDYQSDMWVGSGRRG